MSEFIDFEGGPTPKPLTPEEEVEKALALEIFRDNKDMIMGTIHGHPSTDSEERKAEVLRELKEKCTSLSDYAEKMTKVHTKITKDRWNGEKLIMRDPSDYVGNLRRILICQPGFEGMITRSICDGDPWYYEHWDFNAMILFISEKIGLQEVKEVLM
ncbi:MAG: hypothetical protein HN879_10230 [Flavobacteriaceae bacterium]|jgi:hypothetical protein|nr:hypothetical protein [Flavobacteriaceae bacterium]